jgi:hypothetical protein
MQVVLAIASRPPYHDAVLRFAGEFASVLDAKVWVLRLAEGHSTDDMKVAAEAEESLRSVKGPVLR